MKPLLSQGLSYSVLSFAICGYLPDSRRICQKFARNRPQGHSQKLRELRVQGTRGTNGVKDADGGRSHPVFILTQSAIRICTRIVRQRPESSSRWLCACIHHTEVRANESSKTQRHVDQNDHGACVAAAQSEFEEICERANAAGFDIGATLRDTISNTARQIRKELDAIDRKAGTQSVETIVNRHDHANRISSTAKM